jgi:flagellar biosynthesis protein FlhG
LQNGYGFIKNALYRHLSREFAKDQEFLELLWESDNKESDAQVTSLKEILDYLRDKDPGLYARLKHLLDDFQILLVVNQVKTERDTMSGLIIREVATKYLTIQPEILGNISYDLAVEAAVNLMIPFPLDKDESKPAQDLRAIAGKVLDISRLPVETYETVAKPAPVDQESEDWGNLWQRAPA